MILSPTIFRAYDIRGRAFIDFDEDGFYATAQAYGQYIKDKFSLRNPKIFVSGDGRISMPQLYPAILLGLQNVGADIVWGGAIPTPINFFALHEDAYDASIQISASHNPPDYNGLKFTDRNGSVCGAEIQKIRKLAQCIDCTEIPDLKGNCKADCDIINYSKKYQQKLLAITAKQQPKKIMVDAGNAIPGLYYPEIYQHFGHEVKELFCDLDGNFPNHQPDPEETENLQLLLNAMKKTRVDYGFAFDGDGDRIGIVLSDGMILPADKILYVLAADFLSRNPGEKIVIDIMSSAILVEKIKALGGEVILSPTGHSYIEENMKKHKARFGGEQSGHFMFGEHFYGHDDACLAGLRFLSAVETKPQLITQVTDDWPAMQEYAKKYEVPDEKKFEILDAYIKKMLDQFPEAITVDGIRIEFGKGEWAIVRCSNTSPKISIRIEAKDEASLAEKKVQLVVPFEAMI